MEKIINDAMFELIGDGGCKECHFYLVDCKTAGDDCMDAENAKKSWKLKSGQDGKDN